MGKPVSSFLPPLGDRPRGSRVWAGRCPAPISARLCRAGASGDMRVGRGFTTVARQVPRLAEQSLLFSKTSQKIKKQGMLSEGLENIPCFIILPDVPKQFEGYASHEARCRMAACTRQPAGNRTRPASRGTCRATAVTRSQPAFPQAAPRSMGAVWGAGVLPLPASREARRRAAVKPRPTLTSPYAPARIARRDGCRALALP